MGNIALKWLGLTLEWLGSSTSPSVQYQELPRFTRESVQYQEFSRVTGVIKETKILKKQLEEKNELTISEGEKAYLSKIQYIFPDDMSFEILSRLPVKSLLRMRCVCKKWNNLTQDRHFIEKQMSTGSTFYIFTTAPSCMPTYAFRVIYACDGLLLVRNKITGKYSITNEATKQILHLPNPHNKSFGTITLSFVPSVGKYKLVSIYDTSKQGTFSEITCEILTAGVDNSWRTLKIPDFDNVNKKKRETISIVEAGGFVHFIIRGKIGSKISWEIISLKLETESFTYSALPQDLFPYGIEVRPLNWNGQLAFAYRVHKDLNVVVFDEHKKLKWVVKKIVVPLQFKTSKATLLNNLVPLCARRGDLWFWLNDIMIFSYNIASRKIICERFAAEGHKIPSDLFFICMHSLVTLEGMKPYV